MTKKSHTQSRRGKMKKRNRKIFCLAMLLVSFFSLYSGGVILQVMIIYVDDSNTTGIEDGTPLHPYNTIMEGINAASTGCIVQVADGYYYENVVMKAGVDLIGAGVYHSRINASGSGDVVEGAEGCEISGFYISNSGPDTSNYGIKCSSCSMLIEDNLIYGCTNGIYCSNSSSIIKNNEIINCGSASDPVINYSIICLSSSLTIANNLIINNVDTGIYVCWAGSDSAVIVNNTISDNALEGIWCYNSSPTIKNNIVTNNGNAGIWASYYSFPNISFNNIWNNYVSYYASSGSICEPGIGDISVDPLYVYPSCYDYHISDYSPCISVGTTGPDVPASDFDHHSRPNPPGSRPDMGAFENQTGIGQLPCFHGHDFNGDSISDTSVWRPSNGRWYIKDVGGSVWGLLGDIPANGDYDGDGTTDIAVWRPSNGRWYIKDVGSYAWGTSGDIPVPGNYNGDATTEIAVWRPSNGRWYIKAVGSYVWGTIGDIPVPADYNGDGMTEIAVWRPSNGRWYIKGDGVSAWGTSGDIPVQADYDGDGMADIAVWRPSNGRWYIKGIGSASWGVTGDIPVPGYYNGDAITDTAIWRPSNGRWYIKNIGSYVWGMLGDIPLVR
jgi:parallel beta-helix repeat protein